ncbi:hypothetical protein Q1695_002599 [Nippostrongylus brasiliensis]|nr:hypothetical protein Q1695_002599 [Nippostrongylus brasiliensis]
MESLRRSPSYLYVPPALAPLHITPDSCQLVASYNNSLNKTCFTFSINWSDELRAATVEPSDERLVLSIREPVDERAMVILEPRSKDQPESGGGPVQCDGPCGGKYPPEEMEVIGRCGHFLCKVCHGLVYNEDGTKGCSNFYCAYASLYSFLPEEYARKAYENQITSRQRAIFSSREKIQPDQQSLSSRSPRKHSKTKKQRAATPKCHSPKRSPRRQRMASPKKSKKTPQGEDTSTAQPTKGERTPLDQHRSRSNIMDDIFSDVSTVSSTQEGPTSEFELLHIRLMIFEPGPFNTIKRVHISREMSAALTVKEALDALMDKRAIRHECPSKLYFCADNSRESLRRITVEEFETTRLWQYPARNSVLHFVLDTVGHLRGRGED